MKKKILEFAVLAVIFAGLTVLFFKDVIFSNQILAFRDLGRFFYPSREFTVRLIKQGVMPFWNPYVYCGNPLLASHQAAVFYPFSIVYLFGDFAKAFNNFIYLHIALAGLFMYIFLRDQNSSKTASLIGSLTFAFSGYMFATINLLTFFSSGIWLPMVLWAFFRAMKKGAFLYVLLTSIFLGLMFLAGEPMVCYMTSLILIFLGLRRIKTTLTIFILFVLLSAFQLLPVTEFLMMTDRMNLSYDIATKWSMAPYNFLNLVFPSLTDVEHVIKDYWEKQSWLLDYHIGLFPIIILPIAFFIKDKKRFLISAILAVSIIFSLGSLTPLYPVFFKYFPGFRFFRYPVKYFYLTAFSLSWLCAIGYDFYEKNAKTDMRLAKFIRLFLYAALISGFLLLFVDTFFKELVQFVQGAFFSNLEKAAKENLKTLPFISLGFFSIRRTLIFFLLFVLLLFFGTKRFVNTKLVSFALVALVFADLYSAAYNVNLSCDIEEFKRPSPNIEFLIKDKSIFRILSSPSNIYMMHHPTKETYDDLLEVSKERLYPDRMMEFGLYDVGGYEAVTRNRIQDLLGFLTYIVKSPADSRLLDALNVKYIATPKKLDIEGYRLAKESGIANLYENENVLPRAFLSEKAIVIRGREKIFEKFMDKSWDPEKEVILEEEPHISVQRTAYSVQRVREEGVEITKYSPNEVIVKAAVNSPKFLVLSDSYYPGWKAYIDGRLDKIYAANYILRAVYLDSGEHTVRFVFDPFSFKLGLGISLATLILILFYIVYIKR